MKVIRSKTPLTFGDLNKRDGILAVKISAWTWNEDLNRYEAQVTDYEVTENEAPEPGQPLKNYIPINRRKRTRTAEEVNQLFNYFAVPFEIGDDFTEKSRALQVKGLLMETQQNPIYGSLAEDWEIIDTDTEIAE